MPPHLLLYRRSGDAISILLLLQMNDGDANATTTSILFKREIVIPLHLLL